MYGKYLLLSCAYMAAFGTSHQWEFHHEENTKYMYPDIRTFMKDYQIDVKPVRDIIYVVFSRLWPRDVRCHGDHADTLSMLYELVMKKSNLSLPTVSNDSTSLSTTFNDSTDHNFLVFSENLLTVTIAYHSCCMFHNSLAECIDRRLSETCTHPECAEHRISDRNVFTRVKCLYSRQVPIKGLAPSNRLQYEVDAYANRFLCVNEKLLRTVINPGTLPEEEKRRLPYAIIVVFIVSGYNFIDNEEVCTGSFIADLYNHYGHDGKLNVTQLVQIYNDLRHNNTSIVWPYFQHGNEIGNWFNHDGETDHRPSRAVRSLPNESPAVMKSDTSSTHTRMKAMQATIERSEENTNSEKQSKDQIRRYWDGIRNDHGREEHEQNCWRHLNTSMEERFLNLKGNSSFVTKLGEVKCQRFERLLELYMGKWINGGHNVPTSVFLDMCPALLHQALLGGNCEGHNQHQHPTPQIHHTSKTSTVPTTVRDVSAAKITVPSAATVDAPSAATVDAPSAATVTVPSAATVNAPSATTITVPSTPTPNTRNGSLNATAETLETMPEGYLYGSLSVLVISICSVFGAVFMKVSRADVKTYLMGSMLALAVGCLVSDAALHLLPEVIMSEDAEMEESLLPDHLQKLCAFLGSVYAFFLMEMLLSLRHSHSHSHSHHVDDHIIEEISFKYIKESNAIKEINFMKNKLTGTPCDASAKSMNNMLPKQMNVDQASDSPPSSVRSDLGAPSSAAASPDNSLQILEPRCSNASDRLSSHDPKAGIKALAWMIIIGDGIHNFADGLAIGAAFSITFAKGISTSLTVLCHEIPHELGDFAVLITSGLSIKKAMALNFLSSLTAFAGLYLGLVLGDQQEASRWIFAVGAGMFLYVALTDLVPECKEYFRQKPTAAMFLGQNFGVLLGFFFMLVLAMYEDRLEIKA